MRWLRIVLLAGVLVAGCSTPKDMRELGYHYDDSTRSFVKGPPYSVWNFLDDLASALAQAH